MKEWVLVRKLKVTKTSSGKGVDMSLEIPVGFFGNDRDAAFDAQKKYGEGGYVELR